MNIKKEYFFDAARIFNKVFHKELERDRMEYQQKKKKPKLEIFVLAYGGECIDD